MIEPVEVRPEGDRAMAIVWDDGKECVYSFRLLRKRCPCAGCQDKHGGGKKEAPPVLGQGLQLRLIGDDAPPADPKLVQVDWVGNYALKLVWRDGHNTGIYKYEYLRELCGAEEA